MQRQARLISTTAVGFALLIASAPLQAGPLGSAAIAQQTKRGWHDLHAGMEDYGWVGLQPRIAKCFAEVAATRSEEHAVYCAVLDHLTLLDTMNFPEKLRPSFFATDAVFARLDKAVAQTTPKSDRALFESRLLSTMQETIHEIGEAQRAKRARRNRGR